MAIDAIEPQDDFFPRVCFREGQFLTVEEGLVVPDGIPLHHSFPRDLYSFPRAICGVTELPCAV